MIDYEANMSDDEKSLINEVIQSIEYDPKPTINEYCSYIFLYQELS